MVKLNECGQKRVITLPLPMQHLGRARDYWELRLPGDMETTC